MCHGQVCFGSFRVRATQLVFVTRRALEGPALARGNPLTIQITICTYRVLNLQLKSQLASRERRRHKSPPPRLRSAAPPPFSLASTLASGLDSRSVVLLP